MTRKADGKTYALKKVDVSSLDDKELVSALNEVGTKFVSWGGRWLGAVDGVGVGRGLLDGRDGL